MDIRLDNRVRGRLRLRHLELLDVLDNTGSIHKAAARLSMTQPAASKLLRDAEEIYGGQLFTRSSSGLRPTPGGDAAIRWARSILRSVGDSLTEVQLVREGAQGRVRVPFALPLTIPPVGVITHAHRPVSPSVRHFLDVVHEIAGLEARERDADARVRAVRGAAAGSPPAKSRARRSGR